MNDFDLQEISPNVWKAKYSGNYGIYSIKIKKDGNKTVDFSCTCPSNYRPCKHIPIIEKEIDERISKENKKEITIEELLREIPQNELYNFIVRHSQYNQEFKNTVLLEFMHKYEQKDSSEEKEINIYSEIIRDGLSDLYVDYEDLIDDYGYHFDGNIEIDVLDSWLDKAQKHVNENNPNEALLICKACIEEYAAWYEETDSEMIEYYDISYNKRPFDILIQIIDKQGVNHQELFDYCKSEMLESKYECAYMYDNFSDLFMKLSVLVGSDDYIMLQDKLLSEENDKNSLNTKKILLGKINFFRANNQPEKAWEIIKDNLQFENFRKELTVKLINENQLQEAKKLITDYLAKNENQRWETHTWNELKLQIALKENDTPEIRKISHSFIETKFLENYYTIYKSTFQKEEHAELIEKLFRNYANQSNNFSESAANLLRTEKLTEKLLDYIEKYLSLNYLEKYYTDFLTNYPEKTLSMFRLSIDKYAAINTGRDHYEYIVKLLKKMEMIKGGNLVVREMISQYRLLYKNRRAMMEIINKF